MARRHQLAGQREPARDALKHEIEAGIEVAAGVDIVLYDTFAPVHGDDALTRLVIGRDKVHIFT